MTAGYAFVQAAPYKTDHPPKVHIIATSGEGWRPGLTPADGHAPPFCVRSAPGTRPWHVVTEDFDRTRLCHWCERIWRQRTAPARAGTTVTRVSQEQARRIVS